MHDTWKLCMTHKNSMTFLDFPWHSLKFYGIMKFYNILTLWNSMTFYDIKKFNAILTFWSSESYEILRYTIVLKGLWFWKCESENMN